MNLPTLTPVTSSNVKAVGYDADSSTLFVEFHGSGVYRYEKVPAQVHAEFMAAESPGRFFAANVRGKFGHKPEPAPGGDEAA